MKYPTKVRYGLRAMVELASRETHHPVQLSSVAQAQQLSPKYLHSVMQLLKHADLVSTVRGVHGGFRLTRDPASIRVISVVEALDGPVGVVDCVRHADSCDRSARCPTRGVWCQVSAAIRQVLEAQTLADLAGLEVAG